MTRSFSAYLDGLRFGAAFVVILSHFAYPRFTEGRWLWIRELNLGSDAVIVFFVLSGLVISHAVHRKSEGPRDYAFDRITRLFSVAFPALLIGYALDHLGATIDPATYDGWFYHPLPLWEQLLRGLTFSNEWAGLHTRLGTNGPYWSLSYEASYYVLFGLMVFTRGWRRVVFLAAGAAVVGVNILLLMPCWLLGVAVMKYLASGRRPARKTALVLAAAPVALYVLALAIGLPAFLDQQYSAIRWQFGFSDEFLWNNLLGVLVALHLIGVAGLLRGQVSRFESPVRWLAGGSFSLYLVHYPALQFFAALGLTGPSLLNDAALLGATCLFGLVFAAIFERPLARWRGLVRPLFRPGGTLRRQDAPSA